MAFDFEISGLAVKFFDRTTFVASTWSWDFGDGDTSTVREPSHVYSTPGSYTVVLTATCGTRTSSVSKTLQVSNAPSPDALAVSLSTPWLFGTEYESAVPFDVITDSPVAAIASGGKAPYAYAWEPDTGFDFNSIAPVSPTGASTTFAAVLESPSTSFVGWTRAVCRVTDADGTEVVSSPVSIFLVASLDTFMIGLSTQLLIASGDAAGFTSDPVSTTINGGSGNFSYQWNLETDDIRISLDTPTSDSTTVTATGLDPGETVLVAMNVTITDLDTSDVVNSDWVQVVLTATA